ncbi:pyridoxamine 5'-phosphate oxidase family protein [Micromonospora sp. NPDC003241]
MEPSTFSTPVGDFADLRDDFLRLTTEIGWCAVATVDGRGRPRSRIMHVSWEIGDAGPTGWVSTTRTPVKTAHLARSPYVSCSYWTPAHDAVFVDCRATWLEPGDTKRHVWDMVAAAATQRGFDPYAVWPDGPADAGFEVLQFDPWRVQITLQDLANGQTIGSSRVWHAAERPASTGALLSR